MRSVSIIGAGLVGTLSAIYLARRGYDVDVFEARPDMRISSSDQRRSINLALSCRGITSLSKVGIMPAVEKLLVPMRGRAIHEEGGGVKYQPFGRRHDEYINAVQRNDLNRILLNEAERFPSIRLHFDTQLSELDISGKVAHLQRHDGSRFSHAYQRLIGADGIGSHVRNALQRQGLVTASRRFFSHGYKEITISGPESDHLTREHLHLWPRDSFLLLGNPNPDHSVTGSLFLPIKSKNSFTDLDTEHRIRTFLKQSFTDIFHAMPDPVGDFLDHPTGQMSSLDCQPWYHEDQCLLIGDAAHGLIPFFAQGMNSGFEDCRILDELLDLHQDDWSQVLPAFYRSRKTNTDAVSEMSMANYREIQHGIRDGHFNLKKQLELHLMQHYPTRYISKHVLVMFSNIPYAVALAHGRLQEAFLDRLCARATHISNVDWSFVDEAMVEYDQELARLAM